MNPSPPAAMDGLNIRVTSRKSIVLKKFNIHSQEKCGGCWLVLPQISIGFGVDVMYRLTI